MEPKETEGNQEAVVAGRKRKKLRPEEKWQIFMETNAKGAPVGEILRRHGLYASELTKIRQQVESGALKELGRNRHIKKEPVSYEEYARVGAELAAKEKALAQMSEEYLLLKKE
jgi:transposase-like protein